MLRSVPASLSPNVENMMVGELIGLEGGATGDVVTWCSGDGGEEVDECC